MFIRRATVLQKMYKNLRMLVPVRHYKVTVIGGAGQTGQTLSLFLKMNPLVTELKLYDLRPEVKRFADDLALVDTKTKVQGFADNEIDFALDKTHLVVMIAGITHETSKSDSEQYIRNAKAVYKLAENVARYAPTSILAIVTNPINYFVPLAVEALERLGKCGCRGAANVIGVTTLTVMHATKLISETNNISPKLITVPVIGGNDSCTIVPVLTQCKPPLQVTRPQKIEELTRKIQDTGYQMTKNSAVGCRGTAKTYPFATAYSTARFCDALLRGLAGQQGIIECAFVQSDKTEAPFFASPVLLGKNGVMENLGYGCLSKYEEELLDVALPILCKQAKIGRKFVLSELGYV